MGTTTDLLAGIAADLLNGYAGITYRAAGDYTAGQLGVVFDVVPAGLPDVVTLSTYPVSDAPAMSDSMVGVQVRTRRDGRDPRPVVDLDDAIFDVLHGFTGTLSTGVTVVSCLRRNGASLGQDENDRWMRSSNYYALIHRPSPNRT